MIAAHKWLKFGAFAVLPILTGFVVNWMSGSHSWTIFITLMGWTVMWGTLYE